MQAFRLDSEAVREELERLLKSRGFVRNQRLSNFLRFIVERHLAGRDHELKESVIGTEVFGRKPDYDPKSDPVVRTEARRLRARLDEYYRGIGLETRPVIDLPKGGYVPAINFPLPNGAADAPQSQSLPGSFARPVRAGALALLLIIVAGVAVFVRARHAAHQPSAVSRPAYDIYLRARAAEVRPACRGVELALELFEQAIAKDPGFAPAYAGIAAMEAARSGFDRFSPSERETMLSKGWAAARKAVQLGPQLPETLDAVAMMQARTAQWGAAEQGFRRAIQVAPQDPLWRDHFAVFLLLPLGRIDEAIRISRESEQLEPDSPEVHWALEVAFRAAGRFEDADFHCQRGAEDERQMSSCWADTLARQGRSDEGVQMMERAWDGHLLDVGVERLGIVYARAGRRQDAERIAAIAPRAAEKAFIFAALGEKERTFDILSGMLAMGPTRIGRDLTAPEFDILRGDPRLTAIRSKLGLPKS